MTEEFVRELSVKLRELVGYMVDTYPPSLDEWVRAAAADTCELVAAVMAKELTA